MQDPVFLHYVMAAAARLTQGEFGAVLALVGEAGLGTAERLTALASVVAAAAAKRHAAAPAAFLDRLHELTRPSVGGVGLGRGEGDVLRPSRIADAVALLDGALERLVGRLAEAGFDAPQMAAVEAVLLARLLATHRPHLVRSVLLAAGRAIARADFHPGSITPLALVEATPAAVPVAAGAPRRARAG